MQWHSMLRLCATARKTRIHFPMESLAFSIDLLLPATQLPWGRLILAWKWLKWVSPEG